MAEQPNNQVLYCAVCTNNMLTEVIKQEKEGVEDRHITVPSAKIAWTWSYSVVNGMPVPVPVCLQHLKEFMLNSSSLLRG